MEDVSSVVFRSGSGTAWLEVHESFQVGDDEVQPPCPQTPGSNAKDQFGKITIWKLSQK